jgi:hypothetical protein
VSNRSPEQIVVKLEQGGQVRYLCCEVTASFGEQDLVDASGARAFRDLFGACGAGSAEVAVVPPASGELAWADSPYRAQASDAPPPGWTASAGRAQLAEGGPPGWSALSGRAQASDAPPPGWEALSGRTQSTVPPAGWSELSGRAQVSDGPPAGWAGLSGRAQMGEPPSA